MDAERKNKIAKYIQNRPEEDNAAEQIRKNIGTRLRKIRVSREKKQPRVSGCQR